MLASGALGALLRKRPAGPPPTGTKVLEGIVTSFDVSDDGLVVVAEIRGRKAKPGEMRERVVLAVGPDWSKDPEGLGGGAMLPQVSRDGRWVVWLASKERSDPTGPARLRATTGGEAFDLKRAMPPFVLTTGSAIMTAAAPSQSRVLFLARFAAANGTGALVEYHAARGGEPSQVLTNVPPGYFAPIAGGVFGIQSAKSAVGRCSAIHVTGGRALPIAELLDCSDPRPPYDLSPNGGVLLRRAADAQTGRRALLHWKPGQSGTTPLAEDVDAFEHDRSGAFWWASEEAGKVTVLHEGALAGTIDGSFVRGLHPVPGGGAWITLADRRCTPDSTPSPSPACFRFVAAGAVAPPTPHVVRRVETRPWPLVAFVGETTPPELLAVFDPARPVTVKGPVLGVSVSESGRRLALRRQLEDGESVAIVDLSTGNERVLSTGAPEAGEARFYGERLYYSWKNRRYLSDKRNGLYVLEPDAAAGARADQ